MAASAQVCLTRSNIFKGPPAVEEKFPDAASVSWTEGEATVKRLPALSLVMCLCGPTAYAAGQTVNPYASCDLLILQRNVISKASTLHRVQSLLQIVTRDN